MMLLLSVWAMAAVVAQPRPSVTVTAVNPLAIARANQTIELTRAQLESLGEKDLSRIHVTSAGRELVVQAVDTDFDALHTPDIVIFQSDFAPHERRSFTVFAGERHKYTPGDYKAYGRFVRERFDDFAWENDRIAHRTYGKALETWKGEPLTSSAIDIWSKLTPAFVINEWYMMGDAYYHSPSPNGGDFYTAGPTRGDGGNGVWAQGRLWTSANFVDSRELANGPIRVMFELDYPAFEVAGRRIAEVVRVSLDAGSQLDHYRVTFTPVDGGDSLVGAVGLKKVAGETKVFDAARGALITWERVEKKQGMQGLAVIADPRRVVSAVEDSANDLLLVDASAARSMDYWAGFAWDKAGRITSQAAWERHVRDFADGLRTPIAVTISAP